VSIRGKDEKANELGIQESTRYERHTTTFQPAGSARK
jgi:hypothetical protein